KRQTHLLYWFGWLVPVYGFFSMAQFFHPYYMIMIAPPIAALAAIGIASFVENKTKKKKVEELAEHDSKEENLANDDVVEVEKEAKFA
ncbi:4-amino-4-deoxy-L-arabinose transferase, partial [Lactobacillus mulieris]|nr:4-amino-4-deoxy-L-arabinose transferase [Lactobacillus mulieris]